MTADTRTELASPYLSRPAEALIVEGLRRAVGEAPTDVHGQQAETNTVGDTQNERVLLDALVGTLRRCATCPLRCFPSGAPALCRDECLVLGLVAAIQHGDDDTLDLCLGILACPLRRTEIASAAGEFAVMLKIAGKTLMPIPASAIRDILEHAGQAEMPGSTLH